MSGNNFLKAKIGHTKTNKPEWEEKRKWNFKMNE